MSSAGLCASPISQLRGVGEEGVCSDLDVQERVVIGLYGDVAPNTVANFLALVQAPQGQGFKGTGAPPAGKNPEENPEATSAAVCVVAHRIPFRAGVVD